MAYEDIEIPDDLDPKKYSFMQRRAEIWSFIKEAGHPDLVSRKLLGKRYGVSAQLISYDITAIREKVGQEMGYDSKIISEAVYTKAVKELLKKGEYKQAWDITKGWNDWLFDVGAQEKQPEKVIVDTPSKIFIETMRVAFNDGDNNRRSKRSRKKPKRKNTKGGKGKGR